jgi:hypothetical protein
MIFLPTSPLSIIKPHNVHRRSRDAHCQNPRPSEPPRITPSQTHKGNRAHILRSNLHSPSRHRFRHRNTHTPRQHVLCHWAPPHPPNWLLRISYSRSSATSRPYRAINRCSRGRRNATASPAAEPPGESTYQGVRVCRRTRFVQCARCHDPCAGTSNSGYRHLDCGTGWHMYESFLTFYP